MINMKKIVKNTTVAALAGVMAVGMLSGCGKTIDGEKTVATVDGTDIPMGVVSLYARESQAQTVAMYKSFMGTADNIWSQTVDSESGTTYGEQARDQFLEQVELMYIMKEKAADYNVEVTSDDETAIADAAAQFMSDNDEETLKELAVTEDQVKTLLELETYRQRIYEPIRNEAEINITDEEAQQSAFSYVSISISGSDLTDDDIATRKEEAQEILDKMKEDPSADMGETAKSVNDSYAGLSGTIFTNDSDDEDITNSYDDAVVEALRTLKDGEVYGELVETDSSIYILRMDNVKDDDATASKKESLENTKRTAYYSDTTGKWLEDADITVNNKVLDKLEITDDHVFSIKEVEADTADSSADAEATEETDATDGSEDTEASDTTDGSEDAEASDTTDGSEDAESTDTTESGDDAEAADATESSTDAEASDTTESSDDAETTDTTESSTDTETADTAKSSDEAE